MAIWRGSAAESALFQLEKPLPVFDGLYRSPPAPRAIDPFGFGLDLVHDLHGLDDAHDGLSTTFVPTSANGLLSGEAAGRTCRPSAI